MPERDDHHRSVRHSEIVDSAAETPSRAAAAAGSPMDERSANVGSITGKTRDTGGADLRIDPPENPDDDTLPPPSAHRADTMVRAVSPEARQEMERGGTFGNQPSFTKGVNAPTVDQSSYPYTVEQMDEILTEAPRGLFPDTPGGDGATPLSADRKQFLQEMGNRGHFPSERETERWARAVFNALRQRAVEQDDALAEEFAAVVRVGEAPEVQVQEMMWGRDFLDRMSRALSVSGTWSRQTFYEYVAQEAGEAVDDPWVDAAVYSFLGTLKSFIGDDGAAPELGELQAIWERG